MKHTIIFDEKKTKYGCGSQEYNGQFIECVMLSCEADMKQYGWLYLREIYVRLGLPVDLKEVPAYLGWEKKKFKYYMEYDPESLCWKIIVNPHDLSRKDK